MVSSSVEEEEDCQSQSQSTTTKTGRRLVRTIRSTLPLVSTSLNTTVSENLTDSFIDLHLVSLANKSSSSYLHSSKISGDNNISFSTDISGELQRLAANLPHHPNITSDDIQSEEEISTISPQQNLQSSTVQLYVSALHSQNLSTLRTAASKLRHLAKNLPQNRQIIGSTPNAIPSLIQLLRSPDPTTQEHSVTALLNLSLHFPNKSYLSNPTATKSLIHVLKTGTQTSKQNAACTLLSLALIDDNNNKVSIGACGAIPPLVALLMNGSVRGKKDALTTLYKLCSGVNVNKVRAVNAGVVRLLVRILLSERESAAGLVEKAMVVLCGLVEVQCGRDAVVEEGGIAALVEVIEDDGGVIVSDKGKEFAVFTLLGLCEVCVENRLLLVREGGIPPLVALSQTGTTKAKLKAETLLRYLRESRNEAASTSTTPY